MENYLYYGDNLDILRKYIKDESIDMCYIDPPFNSKRNYNQIYNNIGKEDKAQTLAFIDTWEWDTSAEKGMNEIQSGKFPQKVSDLLVGLQKILGKGSLLAYIVSITLRVNEIHRVLKNTGSFFLHCDPTASHYLKLLLDAIFCSQGGDYINEIVWCYASGGVSRKYFGKKHDVIFFYVKDKKKYIFNTQYRPYSEGTLQRGLTNCKKELNENYELRQEGAVMNDWWTDITPLLSPTSRERLGYPTQKPKALLERIIKATTNEGDIVLDCYCGCGTTIDAAQELNRKWIGCDITYNSISLIEKRLEDTYGNKIKYNLFGVPKDIESAKILAERTDKLRKEFEKWAILTYTNNMGMVNEKYGKDGGIDGKAKTFDNDEWKDILFSVKSGNYTLDMVKAFAKTIENNNAICGFMIVMKEPSKEMKKVAAEMGLYKGMFIKEISKLQFILVQDILDGKAIYPFFDISPDVIKKAQKKEEKGSELSF